MRGFLVLLVSVVLAGCGGGSAAVTPATPPAPLPPCNFSESFFGDSNLVSPANNATAVPASTGSVTVSYLPDLVGLTVALWPNPSTPSQTALQYGGTFAVSGNGKTLTATIPPLTAGTRYAVQTSTLRTVGACAESVGWALGSFTT
jgi:hypothetical protein